MLRNFRKNKPKTLDHKIVEASKVFKGRKIRVRNIRGIRGTCVYTFTYRSLGNRKQGINDNSPTIILVGRAGDGPKFRYPDPTKITGRKSKALGDTYIAGINLNYLSNGFQKYLLTKYGNLSSIPTAEAHKFELLDIVYRIYDTRKLRGLSPLDISTLLNLLPSDDK